MFIGSQSPSELETAVQRVVEQLNKTPPVVGCWVNLIKRH
jgi:hypothetical protein